MKNNNHVTLIVPVCNAETTLLACLASVKKQDYPMKEIIIIDNHSTDHSLAIAKDFAKKNKHLAIRIIERDKTYGISASYNLGAKVTKTELFVTLHSDSVLPTKLELRKLVFPFHENKGIVATFPIVVHPYKTWLQYNFWQKCLFATVVGRESPSMNGKFDCYKKSTYLKIHGYDEAKFSNSIGTEDADMHFRLEKEGKVVPTLARVFHLHSYEQNYSLGQWIARRRFFAVSYTAYLFFHIKEIRTSIIFFLIKPLLVLESLLAFINILFLFPLILFPFVYMPKMFTNIYTLRNPRIILLPFVIIFFVYYETFWMVKTGIMMSVKKNGL